MTVSLSSLNAEVAFLREIVARLWLKLPESERNAIHEAANAACLEKLDQNGRLDLGPAMDKFLAVK